MAGATEPGLGHADDRDAERRVRVCAEARAAAGIKVGVAVDDQQGKVGHVGEHGAQRRQFPQEELAWLVRQHCREQDSPLGLDR